MVNNVLRNVLNVQKQNPPKSSLLYKIDQLELINTFFKPFRDWNVTESIARPTRSLVRSMWNMWRRLFGSLTNAQSHSEVTEDLG